MPQAILLQDVENVGERGTVVDVSKGYLRNFLIPRKLAEPATTGAIQAASRRKEAADRAVATATAAARENAELLNRTVLTIAHQAGEDGRLFGSVTALRKFISDRGKIRSRRITGACRRHQNQIATAVKRAREIALLPYVGDTRESRDDRGGRDRDRDRDRDR